MTSEAKCSPSTEGGDVFSGSGWGEEESVSLETAIAIFRKTVAKTLAEAVRHAAYTMTELSNKGSRLESEGCFIYDPAVWHDTKLVEEDGEEHLHCIGCIAGAATLDLLRYCWYWGKGNKPSAFQKDVEHYEYAIDSIRRGRPLMAVWHFYGAEYYRRLSDKRKKEIHATAKEIVSYKQRGQGTSYQLHAIADEIEALKLPGTRLDRDPSYEYENCFDEKEIEALL